MCVVLVCFCCHITVLNGGIVCVWFLCVSVGHITVLNGGIVCVCVVLVCFCCHTTLLNGGVVCVCVWFLCVSVATPHCLMVELCVCGSCVFLLATPQCLMVELCLCVVLVCFCCHTTVLNGGVVCVWFLCVSVATPQCLMVELCVCGSCVFLLPHHSA